MSSYPGETLALVAGSHKLFCITPLPGNDGYLHAQSTVISPYVQLIIQDAVSHAKHEKTILRNCFSPSALPFSHGLVT